MARRGLRNIFLVTAGNLLSPIVALVTAPMLASGLGVSGRGEMAAAVAPLLLGASALTLGVPEALTNSVARFGKAKLRHLVIAVVITGAAGVMGAVVLMMLAPALSAGNDQLAQLIRVCAVALPFALLIGIPRGVARGRQRWEMVVSDQLASSLTKLLAFSGLYFAGELNPTRAALVIVASVLIGAIAYIPLLRRGDDSSPITNLNSTGSLFAFALAVWPGAVAGVVLSRLDQTLIVPLASTSALGIYAVAMSLSDAARMFNAAVRDVVFARQSLLEDDSALCLASRLSTLMTTVIATVVVLLAVVLVEPVFGSEFRGVVPVLAILLLGVVVGNPGSVTAAGLAARGRPMLRSFAILAGVGLNVFLLFLLVPSAGAVGAAIAAAVANATTGQLVVLLAWRVSGIPPRMLLMYHRGDVSELARAILDLARRR